MSNRRKLRPAGPERPVLALTVHADSRMQLRTRLPNPAAAAILRRAADQLDATPEATPEAGA